MSKQIVNIAKKKEPVLLDKVLQELQSLLLSKLKWLDYAFGRAYKLVEHTSEGGSFTYPAVYNNQGEYLSVMPNDTLGNFSWFDIYDPQDIDNTVLARPKLKITGALIFWYRLDTIYSDNSVLYTEEIKNEILRVLTTNAQFTANSRIKIKSIYEKYENIYKGYIYPQAGPQEDKQFFMYPFAGLRIEFEITTQELCASYLK